MNARTIPWETIADWYKENEQVIRDVMKFEGLRGAVNEVLRLAPDQPELAALREELAAEKTGAQGIYQQLEICQKQRDNLQQRLTAAEQRNVTLGDALLKIIEMNRQHAEDQYGDPDKAESWACIRVAREAMEAKNAAS